MRAKLIRHTRYHWSLIVLLFVAIGPGVTSAQSEPVNAPPNSHATRYGRGWQCDRGYREDEHSCVAVDVPLNALLDSRGREVGRQATGVSIPAYFKQYNPQTITLPRTSGGYLVLAEFTPELRLKTSPVTSRRYIKVGTEEPYSYYDYKPKPLDR